MKRKLLLLCVLPTLLCGCAVEPLPGMELSQRLIVAAVGIDASPAGVTLTLQAIDPSPEQADEKGNRKWAAYDFTAGNVAQAVNAAKQRTGKEPFFAYAGVLLFGKTAAAQGLTEYLDFFLRNRTVRNTVDVCVADKSAAEILGAETEDTQSPAKKIEQALRIAAKSGQCAAAPFFQFVNRMLSQDTEAFCPILSADDAHMVDCGSTAVFSGDRFRFSLTREETQAFLLITDAAREGFFCVTSAQNEYGCRLRHGRTTIRGSKKDPSAATEITLRAGASVVQISGASSLPAAKADRAAAERALQAALEKAMERCVNKIYARYGTDLLRIRKRRRLSPDVPPETLRFCCTARITVS